MDTQTNTEINKNIEGWLNNISKLEPMKEFTVGNDNLFYVTNYMKIRMNTPESLAKLFRPMLNKRWPKQNLTYNNNGNKTADGLFRIAFTGNDVRLEFDSKLTGKPLIVRCWYILSAYGRNQTLAMTR
jgi:hypothetical protein